MKSEDTPVLNKGDEEFDTPVLNKGDREPFPRLVVSRFAESTVF